MLRASGTGEERGWLAEALAIAYPQGGTHFVLEPLACIEHLAALVSLQAHGSPNEIDIADANGAL